LLNSICASNCLSISDEALEHIAIVASCSSLEHIVLNRCRQITTNGVLGVINNAPNLQSLRVKGCPKVNPSAIISIIFQKCQYLSSLMLGASGWYNAEINTAFQNALIAVEGNQGACFLECLDISCGNPFGSRSPLSAEALGPFLAQCHSLKHLYLKGHAALSSNVLGALPIDIKTLDLTGCSQICANLTLLSTLTSLEELIMYACPNVTDTVIHSLKETNMNLKTVDVEGCQVSHEARQLFAPPQQFSPF